MNKQMAISRDPEKHSNCIQWLVNNLDKKICGPK